MNKIVVAERGRYPARTKQVVNRALLPPELTDEEILALALEHADIMLVEHPGAIHEVQLNSIALYFSPADLAAMKELAMHVDRTHHSPDVKSLAWEIVRALDKLGVAA